MCKKILNTQYIRVCTYIHTVHRKPNNMTERARIPAIVYPPHKPACHNLSIPEMHRYIQAVHVERIYMIITYSLFAGPLFISIVYTLGIEFCVYIGRSSDDIVNSVFDVWTIFEHYGVNDLHT